MREILFRGKRCDNGEWVNGSLLNPYRKKPLIAHYEDGQEILGYIVEVISETVGQYTGLTDKNGTRIFEGDILRFPYPSTQNIYSVMWGGGSFVRKDPDGYYLSLNALNCDEYEVIGNIHDNPELLGGENNG